MIRASISVILFIISIYLASKYGIHYHDMPSDEEVPFFLAQELIPGWLRVNGVEDATYCPPKGYFVADENPEAFQQYEDNFPPKEKLRLPARDGEPLIGYWIAKPYWNRGICTEALGLMIEHIRQVTDVKSLISGHFVDNPASGRVMEKCGFIPTGETVIDEAQYQGKDHPIRVLRLELR